MFVPGFQPNLMFVRLEPTRVKRLLVFHSRVGFWSCLKLCCKGMLGTNTLSYYEQTLITDVKSFITLGPDHVIVREIAKFVKNV